MSATLVFTSVSKEYPIRVVSRMTGISVDTLRAWERRYHVVNPDRSARGRLYDESHVQRFLQLRDAVASGYAIGQVAALSGSELEELARCRPSPAASVASAHNEGLIAAVESFDSRRLNQELGRLAALLSPAEFVDRVVLPLMREVGARWHAGTMRVAHEHMVTEGIRSLLGAMARLNRPADSPVKILTTTPAGELHEVGIVASAMLAGARGMQVACLGPNLPADEILFAVACAKPHVVLLGLTTPEPLPASRDTVRSVADGLPAETELWLGGEGAAAVLPVDRPGSFAVADFRSLDRNLTRLQKSVVR